MSTVIGIDLGTTNSAVALQRLVPEVLRNAEGSQLTPSVVTYISSHQVVVGQKAKDLSRQYPKETVASIKRLIGRTDYDPSVRKLLNGYKYGPKLNLEPETHSVSLSLHGETKSPIDISAEILSKLLSDAEARIGSKPEKVVVTVPAYFSDRQKYATRKACEQVGLEPIRLLPEPTAAALSFGQEQSGDAEAQTIMVFDLGGGTFDVSLLSKLEGHYLEITKGGDMWLGGDDIDQLLYDYALEQTAIELTDHGIDLKGIIGALGEVESLRFSQALKHSCEQAKIALSTEDSAIIDAYGYLQTPYGEALDIDVELSLEKFEKIIDPVIKKIERITNEVLREVNFEPGLIDKVLLVGGSSLIRGIQKILREIFGDEKVVVHPRPMFAVAEGASIMAHRMSGGDHQSDESLTLSTAHDYFLQLANGEKTCMIAKSSPLPAHHKEKLRFSSQDQELARLRILNAIEGIMEPVAEVWIHRHLRPLDVVPNYLEIAEQTYENIEIDLEVSEDNIVALKARLATREDDSGAVSARSGIATGLYKQLEEALAFGASKRSHRAEVVCLERLAAIPSQLIARLSLESDPKVCSNLVEKIENQIETLRDLAELGGNWHFWFRAIKQFPQIFEPLLNDELLAEAHSLGLAYTKSLSELSSAEEIESHMDAITGLGNKLSVDLDLQKYLTVCLSSGISRGVKLDLLSLLRDYAKQKNRGSDSILAAADRFNMSLGQFEYSSGDFSNHFKRDVVLQSRI